MKEKKREREGGDRIKQREDSMCIIPWSVFVAGFQFSGLMMGRQT